MMDHLARHEDVLPFDDPGCDFLPDRFADLMFVLIGQRAVKVSVILFTTPELHSHTEICSKVQTQDIRDRNSVSFSQASMQKCATCSPVTNVDGMRDGFVDISGSGLWRRGVETPSIIFRKDSEKTEAHKSTSRECVKRRKRNIFRSNSPAVHLYS